MDTTMKTEQKTKLKKTRLPYSSQLTQIQLDALRTYFEKNRYPKHADKKRLSESHNIDPFLINKWFQGERGRYNKQKKNSSQQNSTDNVLSSVKGGGITKKKTVSM